MPVYKTLQLNSHTTARVWKITESYFNLFEQVSLKPESLTRLNGMKSELHQRGFLSVRCLLNEFGYTDTDLFYGANGKPHLKDGKQISITHSFTFSAVVVSDEVVGIDIEKQRPKITRIASKFIDYEFLYLDKTAEDYVNKLTVIWCVKESLYKLYATPGLSFRENTLVIPFEIKDENTLAWIGYEGDKKRYQNTFFEFEGFTCAIALPA